MHAFSLRFWQVVQLNVGEADVVLMNVCFCSTSYSVKSPVGNLKQHILMGP